MKLKLMWHFKKKGLELDFAVIGKNNNNDYNL